MEEAKAERNARSGLEKCFCDMRSASLRGRGPRADADVAAAGVRASFGRVVADSVIGLGVFASVLGAPGNAKDYPSVTVAPVYVLLLVLWVEQAV